MYLLLTAATAAEIQPTVDLLSKKGSAHYPFAIQVLITGVTATATTYWLTRAICKNAPSMVIQAGVAGSFDERNMEKVVAISEDQFADCGVWEDQRFKTIYELGFGNETTAPCAGQLLENPHKNLLSISGLPLSRAITVNEISTRADSIDWYKQNLSPAIESMEGAALHYVCLIEKIPFLQLRAVSNLVGERDKTKWKLGKAVDNLNRALSTILDKLAEQHENYFRI